MKLIGSIFIACFSCASQLFSQTITIPDKHFLNALIEAGVDSNGDNLISKQEAELISSLDISGNRDDGISGEIKSMAGIEAFVNLDTLRCNHNQISNLDLSKNTSLTFLRCNDNQLTSLDLSACKALIKVYCERNQLSSLDLPDSPSVKWVTCRLNQLSHLDVSACTELAVLVCDNNQLSRLNVMNNTFLASLQCWENRLSSLDVSACKTLSRLDVDFNALSSLNVSNNSNLKYLNCRMNQLTSLDVTACSALLELNPEGNLLTELYLADNPLLEKLVCSKNKLRTLDISNNTRLKKIVLRDNPELTQVCVWTLPLPTETVTIMTEGSPRVRFTRDCSSATERSRKTLQKGFSECVWIVWQYWDRPTPKVAEIYSDTTIVINVADWRVKCLLERPLKDNGPGRRLLSGAGNYRYAEKPYLINPIPSRPASILPSPAPPVLLPWQKG